MKKRRLLSIVISLCMVLAFMPQMAFAEGAGNPYSYIEGTAGAGDTEGPGRLIDGYSSTKWCVKDFTSAYTIFSTASPVNVSGYSITTGDDNSSFYGRNPKNWTLYGCNDSSAGRNSESWIPIHSVTNDIVLEDVDKTTYNFGFDRTETAYQYYKLEITAIKRGDVMQMSEFALTDCDHRWGDSIVEKPTCTSRGYTKKVCKTCNSAAYSDYKEPVEHDFSGADGKCKYCGYSLDELNFTYLNENGESCTSNDNTIRITEGCTTWNDKSYNDGWYIVHGEVTIENNISVSGDVHLILADGCNLKVTGNITGGSLTIYGQAGGTGKIAISGSIISGTGANGSDDPVTSSNGGSGGNITINGGTINAGGIAGGNGGYGGLKNGGNGGSIIIRGGVVKTDSIVSGTGGNGGKCKYNTSVTDGGNGGNITISGGIVEAVSFTSGNGGIGNASQAAMDAGKHGKDGDDGTIDISGGIVFQDNSGQVYGNSFTLSENFTISDGKILTIDSGKKLIIPDGVTLTNNGTVENNGKIYVDGTFTGTAANLYYPLTVENATATGDISEYNSKNYGKAGSTITLSATSQVGKIITWTPSPEVDIIDNSFTMPNEALTVTAQWIECTHTGDKETRNAKEATCTEKGYSGDEYCLVCNKMITRGHDTNMVSHKLNPFPKTDASVTETGNKEYWQCKDCQKYFSDAGGTNEITDLESWKAGEGQIDKLPPEIIKGKGQSLIAGEKKALSFTSNAAYSDFIRVELDHETIDSEYYTAEAGSIIVTLDADYVATLPAGEHTIGIVSTSGTATTTFTVAEKAASGTTDDSDKDSKSDEDSVKTGDNTNIALWLALMLLSGAGITGVTAYTRRKRTNE